MNIRIVKQKRCPDSQESPKRLAKETSQLFGVDLTLNVSATDRKSYEAVKDGDVVVDYRNVIIRGYLSTWQSTTPSDRDGDYVVRGAFLETIPQFMQNPVLLVNHENCVQSIAGKFMVVREDDKGLYVEAKLSDSPSECARDIRWKVANDELRTLSMGGYFLRGADGRAIEKVALYEGSLTPVPANPDATFSVRKLEEPEMKKAQVELGK